MPRPARSGRRVIGAIGILRDMRELDKAPGLWESLIKNCPDPVFVSDLEGQDSSRPTSACPNCWGPAGGVDRAIAVALH